MADNHVDSDLENYIKRNYIPRSEVVDSLEKILLRLITSEINEMGVQEGAIRENKQPFTLDEAIRQIENFYRNKIPKEKSRHYGRDNDDYHFRRGYNQAIDDIIAQFNSKGDKV